MYYNPETKQIKSLDELKKILNACIPFSTKEINGWYLLYRDYPEYDYTKQKLEKDEIVKNDDIYIQTYKVVDLSKSEILQEAKKERNKLVESLTVEVDGLLFDANELAQTRMTRYILTHKDDEVVDWVLADNTLVKISVSDLKEVLAKASTEMSNLWTAPYKNPE